MNKFNRRKFIRAGGGLVVSFVIPGCGSNGGFVAKKYDYETYPGDLETFSQGSPGVGSVDAWLSIDESGDVTVFTGWIDPGNGIHTVIHQIVSDELDVPIESISNVCGDTATTPYTGISQSSAGVPTAMSTVRIAGAAARAELRRLGAEKLGAGLHEVFLQAGMVRRVDPPDVAISYGELLKGRQFEIDLSVESTWNAPVLSTEALLKSPSERASIGRSIPRIDIPDKVFGRYEFIQNVRVPNMWHGRVVRPPSERTCELIGFDPASISHLDDTQVVNHGSFVAVVARREEDAVRAAEALQVDWKVSGRDLPVGVREKFTAVTAAPVRRVEHDVRSGNPSRSINHTPNKVSSTYTFGYQLHAVVGPSCAVADVRADGSATLWSGTQNPHGDRVSVAEMLGLDPNKVRLVWRQAAGGYGRFTVDDAVADAALCSKLAGRPVRIQWSRQEENGWEPISPAMVVEIVGAVDSDGRIAGIEHDQWSARHMLVPKGHMLAWRHSGQHPAEGWAWGGGIATAAYDVADIRITRHVTEDIVRPMSLRTPGKVQSVFAFESMIDELANSVGQDPIDFRLRNLVDSRARRVIKVVQQRSDWIARAASRSVSSERLFGMGVAYVEHYGAHLATVVCIGVNASNGQVSVDKVWVVADHGEIMNPDGLRSQIEGGTLQGISRSLYEDVIYENSVRTNLDWSSYPVIRYDSIPDIDIHLVAHPGVEAVGAGEPSSAPLPAAIGNAIFDAIGVRLYEAPFSRAQVMSALESRR